MVGDVQGYSGFFDFVKVGTAELDQIYEHDLALVKEVEDLVKQTSQLSPAAENHGQIANQLRSQIDALGQKFSERANILQGLSE
jgi:hypothetical protein